MTRYVFSQIKVSRILRGFRVLGCQGFELLDAGAVCPGMRQADCGLRVLSGRKSIKKLVKFRGALGLKNTEISLVLSGFSPVLSVFPTLPSTTTVMMIFGVTKRSYQS